MSTPVPPRTGYKPNLNITNAFACPIATTVIANCEQLNQRLHALFLEWEANEDRPRSSLPTKVVKPGVYESDFSLFTRTEPEIQQLAGLCLNHLGYLVAELNGYAPQEMASLRIYHHSWYHITRDHGYTASHNHPMASWSGVYCVTPGNRRPDVPNNGSLRFTEGRTTAGMYLDPGNANLHSPYGIGDRVYDLVAGQLVLFPSYLMHEVAPYEGDGERITVAFNAWLRYADQAVDEPGIRI